MKSFVQLVHDEVSLEAIEKFANRLMIKYDIAKQQETKGDEISQIGIGYELSISILQKELEKAREELK